MKDDARLTLYTRCCDGSATEEQLVEMYESERRISYQTFARHVDVATLSEDLGYTFGPGKQPGLRLSNDYSVSFYRAKFRGKPCYYMDWSRIDHIFLSQQDKLDLQNSETI